MKVFLSICFMLILLLPGSNYAQAGYREVNTSVGKVITGIDRDQALDEFGVPARASDRVWHYLEPEELFVSFPDESSSRIYLYPSHPYGLPGVPLEFKVFVYRSDTGITDITRDARLLIDKPRDFTFGEKGVIIPARTGEYRVLAEYKRVFSNPAHIRIEGSSKGQTEEEKLISINILPYKPVIPYRGRFKPVALGVFQDRSGQYNVKDISKEVTWRIRQQKEVLKNRYDMIFGVSHGEAELFCSYLNTDSYPQKVAVQERIPIFNKRLKHITLLPQLTLAGPGKKLKFRVFGSYRNNEVGELTDRAKWDMDNRGPLTFMGRGEFMTKAPGVTNLAAELEGLRSAPAKIIVTQKQRGAFLALPVKEEKADAGKLMRDIRNETEKLKQEFKAEEKKLSLIKIDPARLEIALGESGQVKALGVYNDKTEEDLTRIAEWSSSSGDIVKVAAGKADTFSQGEAMVYASFKGIKSLPATIKVGGPKLLSIILSPQTLRISMLERPDIKVEGYFSDSSRKDITSLSSWEFGTAGIARVKDNKIYPIRFGETELLAEYSGLKSLPANITVVITLGWVMHMAARGALLSLSAAGLILVVLYILTEEKKRYLRGCLERSPRDFVIDLYDNIKGILSIFSLGRKLSETHLSYARNVQKRYSAQDDIFLKLTERFEEAKYSSHTISKEEASCALNDYNTFVRTMLARHNKLSVFFKYCLTLMRRRPLFIPNK